MVITGFKMCRSVIYGCLFCVSRQSLRELVIRWTSQRGRGNMEALPQIGMDHSLALATRWELQKSPFNIGSATSQVGIKKFEICKATVMYI